MFFINKALKKINQVFILKKMLTLRLYVIFQLLHLNMDGPYMNVLQYSYQAGGHLDHLLNR